MLKPTIKRDVSLPWKQQREAYNSALVYVKKRKEGTVSSFKTPWIKMNDAGVNGLEWHSMTVIGGRPGTGKTLIKDQIVREAFQNNKGKTINILEFQFEMVARAAKVREFSAVLGKPYKYICSAYENNRLTSDDYEKLKAHSEKMCNNDKYPVDIVEKPCTVNQLVQIVEKYMHAKAVELNGRKKFIDTVITLDHSLLLKTASDERTKTDMLYNLGEAITGLKRRYPIAFIILSQLGRHVETPERNENGKYGNFILETDIFGGDALMQHADMVIGVNRPGKKNIKFYGPDKIPIADESILAWHFIKCRSGDTRISFFRAEFEKMQVVEIATPGSNNLSTSV